MRLIWWRISRTDEGPRSWEFMGDTLNMHLPENQSPVQLLQNGESGLDRDWLTRLLQWSERSH